MHPSAGPPAAGPPPPLSASSDEADGDMRLILELLGDDGEMEALFRHDPQHEQQQLQQLEQQLEQQPQAGATISHADSGQGSRSALDGAELYAQLAGLQQQLQQLQSAVGQHMQRLAQQGQQQQGQHAGVRTVEGMRQTLAHMQGLLAATQLQQTVAAAHAADHASARHHPMQHMHMAVSQSGGGSGAAPQPLQQAGSASEPSVAPAVGASKAAGSDPTPQQQQEKRRGRVPKPRQKPLKTQLEELMAELEAKKAEADTLAQKNEDLKRRQRVLGMVIEVRESQMQRQSIVKARPQDLAATYDTFTQSSRSPFTNMLSVDKLKNMDLATSAFLYHHMIQELSRLVGQMPQGPEAAMAQGGNGRNGSVPDGPYAQLEEMINEIRELARYMQLVNPHAQAVLYDNGLLSPPSLGHWALVLAAIAMSDEQKADALVLRDIHTRLTAQVYRQRRQLASELQDALASEMSAPTSVDLTALTPASEASAVAMERLHRNVLKERCLLFLTGETFYNALDAPQCARMCLACYPHKPDEIAMWNELARQRQQQRPQQQQPQQQPQPAGACE